MHLRNIGPLLGLLERILNLFALDSLVSTYKDCGQPHLDYCCVVSGGLYKLAVNLQRLQNRAARITTKTKFGNAIKRYLIKFRIGNTEEQAL